MVFCKKMVCFTAVAALLLGALLWALNVPVSAPVELPALNQHAVRKHHRGASIAWMYVRFNGYKCGFECPDGRTRFICLIDFQDGEVPSLWAIVVVEGMRLVTSFVTRDEGYALAQRVGCKPWGPAH